MSAERLPFSIALIVTVASITLLGTACRRDARDRVSDTLTLVEDAQHPPGTAPAPNPPAGDVVGPGGITRARLALGDSIFHGQVAGGTCATCHGQDAKGTALAPDLTDQQWLNGDGTYQSVVNTVVQGVPSPKAHSAPMPPMGGASLTNDQIQAVASYVYSLHVP